jgi:hypothetical protein
MATYHFVTYEGRTQSKHKSLEVATKKRDALIRNNSYLKINKYKPAIYTGEPRVNVITCETGSAEYEKHMEQIAFNKEEREKYNCAYQIENPEGYKEFLEKRANRYKRLKEERQKSLQKN